MLKKCGEFSGLVILIKGTLQSKPCCQPMWEKKTIYIEPQCPLTSVRSSPPANIFVYPASVYPFGSLSHQRTMNDYDSVTVLNRFTLLSTCSSDKIIMAQRSIFLVLRWSYCPRRVFEITNLSHLLFICDLAQVPVFWVQLESTSKVGPQVACEGLKDILSLLDVPNSHCHRCLHAGPLHF